MRKKRLKPEIKEHIKDLLRKKFNVDLLEDAYKKASKLHWDTLKEENKNMTEIFIDIIEKLKKENIICVYDNKNTKKSAEMIGEWFFHKDKYKEIVYLAKRANKLKEQLNESKVRYEKAYNEIITKLSFGNTTYDGNYTYDEVVKMIKDMK